MQGSVALSQPVCSQSHADAESLWGTRPKPLLWLWQVERTEACASDVLCWATGTRRPVLGSILKPLPDAAAGSCTAAPRAAGMPAWPLSQASVAALLGGSWTGVQYREAACNRVGEHKRGPGKAGAAVKRLLWMFSSGGRARASL